MSLIFLVVLLGIMYFIMIRPQQKRMKEHAALLRSLEPGMVVVTNAGIHGAVAELEDKVVWLEVAPEVELKVSRGSIAEIVDDDEGDDEDEAEANAAADEDS
ncbi:MAG: preprotein translocase subunit YajC [Acidimicrobiales bacterium]|jgi:preprotein translocase subunit YajC